MGPPRITIANQFPLGLDQRDFRAYRVALLVNS